MVSGTDRVERSGFETRLGQRACCVLRQNTSLSQCLSLSSQEYTWVLANCQESLVTSHRGGSDNTPTMETGISSS